MVLRGAHNCIYKGIPLGRFVRKSIGKDKTFRVRRGAGFPNIPKGDVYQDQYTYFAPTSINNATSDPRRRQWAAAVDKWKTGLTPAEKATYNKRIHSASHMSGYNLFMREAMKGQVSMFVDRGDPAAVDFVKTDLTRNGTWQTLDLSSIIPPAAKGVLLKARIQAAPVGNRIRFRKKGNTNEKNTLSYPTLAANIIHRPDGVCAVNSNSEIEYNADNITWTTLDLVVRGWWT